MTSTPVAPWVRNTLMLIVCAVWSGFVVDTFLHGQIPSAVVWAVPGATYAALVGAGGGRRIKVTVEDEADAEKPDDKGGTTS